MTDEMVTYYARRAAEYDRVYEIPEWRRDLEVLRSRVAEFFAGRRVFEVACGTGYWTRYAALQAVSVDAIDVNEETLAIARSRHYPGARPTFARVDAYAMSGDRKTRDAGLAAFWLSHVDLGRMREFLEAFHAHLVPDAPVMMFDERPIAVRGLPASRADPAGNRYELRRLANGERFEIIKNFYDGKVLAEMFGTYGRACSYEDLENFWVFTYRVDRSEGLGRLRWLLLATPDLDPPGWLERALRRPEA